MKDKSGMNGVLIIDIEVAQAMYAWAKRQYGQGKMPESERFEAENMWAGKCVEMNSHLL